MKQVILYIVNGWCNDDAPWLNVFCSLFAFGIVFFLLTFLITGWMFILY